MRNDLVYTIFGEKSPKLYIEIRESVDIQKLWDVIDTFSSPIPDVFHKLYDEEGKWRSYLLKEAARELNVDIVELNKYRRKGIRLLRNPINRYMYQKKTEKTRNSDVLESLATFCKGEGKDLRFWQAVSVWSGKDILLVPASPIRYDNEAAMWRSKEARDPYYWEGKDG